MTAWWAAGQVALVVFVGFTALLFVGCLAAWLFNAVRDAVRTVERSRTDVTPECDDIGADALPYGPGWYDHDELMTHEEREAERNWLKQMYGPPVSPGRE